METTLESTRLQLREVCWDDLEDFFRLHSYPEVDRFNTLGIPESMETTQEVLRPPILNQQHHIRDHFVWCVCRKEDGQFIGETGMKIGRPKTRRGEIYYNLAPPFWGNGFATELGMAVLRFGFEQLNLHRIEAGAATENHASWRVLEKIGMQREGLGREILPIRGAWVDNYSYAMLESDPRPWE